MSRSPPGGSGGPPGGPRGIGSPMRKSGMGREAPPEVRERSEGPPEGLGQVRRPTLRSGRGREDHPKVREAQLEILKGQ